MLFCFGPASLECLDLFPLHGLFIYFGLCVFVSWIFVSQGLFAKGGCDLVSFTEGCFVERVKDVRSDSFM